MMQDQHKAMFMALRDGQFDALLDELAKGNARPSGTSLQNMPAVQPGKAPPELSVATKAPVAVTSPPAVPAQPAAPPPPLPTPLPAPPQPSASVRPAPRLAEPPPVAKAERAALRPPSLPPPAPPHPGTVPPPPGVRPPTMPPPPGGARPAAIARFAERPQAETRSPGPPTTPVIPVVVPPAPPVSAPSPIDAQQPPGRSAATGPPVPKTPATAPTTRIRSPAAPQARPRLELDPAAIHRAPVQHLTPSGGTLASVVETAVDDGPNIDLSTLERAAAEAEAPLFQQIHDLPPPPAAVLGSRGAGSAGGYSSVSAPAPPPPPPPSARGRYAPTRPSSIFSAVRPPEGPSIFGEDLISEKSLDEVILSYLAEDLDGPGEKK